MERYPVLKSVMDTRTVMDFVDVAPDAILGDLDDKNGLINVVHRLELRESREGFVKFNEKIYRARVDIYGKLFIQAFPPKKGEEDNSGNWLRIDLFFINMVARNGLYPSAGNPDSLRDDVNGAVASAATPENEPDGITDVWRKFLGFIGKHVSGKLKCKKYDACSFGFMWPKGSSSADIAHEYQSWTARSMYAGLPIDFFQEFERLFCSVVLAGKVTINSIFKTINNETVGMFSGRIALDHLLPVLAKLQVKDKLISQMVECDPSKSASIEFEIKFNQNGNLVDFAMMLRIF